MNINNYSILSNQDISDNTHSIIEISDIYTNSLIKRELRAEQRGLISYLRSEAYSMCRTDIPYDYIKYSFNKFKNGYVYYDNTEPIAFCIWRVKTYVSITAYQVRGLYIYLICGRKMNYRLFPRIIDDIVHLCRKENIQYITLEPANDALKAYYMNCGFREGCEVCTPSMLGLTVSNSRMPISNSKRAKRSTRKKGIDTTVMHWPS